MGGGCCKQTLKPLFVWDPLFDRKAKWTLQGQKKNGKHEDLWVRFNFQKVSNIWNGFFIFRSGEVKNIKNRVFKSHKKITKAIKQSHKQGSHWKGVTPVDRRRWNLPPQCTTVRVTWAVWRLVTHYQGIWLSHLNKEYSEAIKCAGVQGRQLCDFGQNVQLLCDSVYLWTKWTVIWIK